jgi:hypothetical protein
VSQLLPSVGLLVVAAVVYGGLFAFVGYRRRLAARWVPSDTGFTGGRFQIDRVWSTSTPPRRSLVAWRQWGTGVLQVEGSPPTARIMVFKGSDVGEVVDIDPVTEVTMGKRGNDLVNTWIEVRFGEPGRSRTLYLNDGAWLGWRPMLTSSNIRMADALAATIRPAAELQQHQA